MARYDVSGERRGRSRQSRPPLGKARSALLITLGFVFVGLAVVGAVLPLIPTTGPLLLAAALFARSSPRFHRWLLNHRLFGTYIRNYHESRGMTRRHKTVTLLTLWLGVGISIYLSRHTPVAVMGLVVVLVGVTIHIFTLATADPAGTIAEQSARQ